MHSPQTTWEKLRPFVFGGVSGMTATSVVQPIDNIKVRIQIFGETAGFNGGKPEMTNIFKTASKMIREEGVRSLYRGLDAGLLRQCCYASVRLGSYKYLSEHLIKIGTEISTLQKFGLAMSAGFIGAVVGSPLDLSLVRFQTDATLPLESRRNYRNVFDALNCIISKEGTLTLWRGFPGFACRVMMLTGAQMTTFDEVKVLLNKLRGIQHSDFLSRFV